MLEERSQQSAFLLFSFFMSKWTSLVANPIAEGWWSKMSRFETTKGVENASLVKTSVFESSDSVRHAHFLRHAQSVTFDQALELELGSHLPSVTVAYETYGQL